MAEWIEVKTEMRENFGKVTDRLTALEHHTIQYQVLFEERSKQDVRTHEVLEELKLGQGLMNRRLDTYNQELHIHILGVKELKEMNRKLTSLIDMNKKQSDDRLTVLEAPYEWVKGAKAVFWYLWTIGAGLAGAYAFYIQFLKKP